MCTIFITPYILSCHIDPVILTLFLLMPPGCSRVFWSLQAVVTEFLLPGTLMKSGLKETEGS